MNGAMGQGYVPDAQHGYWGQEPAPRPKKRRSIGGIILTAFGTVIIVASIVGCIAIDLIPGDHGDSGDGLAWAGVALLLYVVPFGLMLVVSGLILVYAARSRSR
jgi:flagellar transport protein fliP